LIFGFFFEQHEIIVEIEGEQNSLIKITKKTKQNKTNLKTRKSTI